MGNRDLRDFASAFMQGFKMVEDAEYKKALIDYYKSKSGGGNSLYGYRLPEEEKPGLLGRIFGGDKPDEPALSDVERGIKNNMYVRSEAMKKGDWAAVAKVDKGIADNQHLFGKRAAPAGGARPAVPAKSAADPEKPAADPRAGRLILDPAKKSYTPNSIYKPQSYNADQDQTTDEAVFKQEDNDQPDITNAAYEAPAVNDEPSDWFSNGGMVPTRYAAVGGPINGPIDEDELDDPAGADSMDDEHEEDAAHGVSVKMAQAAEPGVAAGLKYIAKASAQSGAIPDGSPNPVAKRLGTNEGAATHDEVAAIDKIVDPEGKLPPSAKSAARIAAIYDFYDKRGEPDKGADLASRLMLYDKQNSQTRGMLAENALKNGDTATAARLLQDAHNNDLPGGDIMKANLTDDGSGSVKFIRANGTEEDMKVTPQQVAQVARGAANGSEYVNWALGVASAHEQNKAAKAKPSTVDNELFDELRRAKRAFARAIASNDNSEESKANIQKYSDKLDELEERVHDWAKKQKNPSGALKYYGVTEVPTSTLSPFYRKGQLNGQSEPKLSAKEREQRAAEDEINGIRKRLDNIDTLEEHGVEVDETGKAKTRREIGYKATDQEKKAARDSLAQHRARLETQLAMTAYDQADGRDEFRKGTDFKTRVSDYKQGLDDYLTTLNGKDKNPVELNEKIKKEYYNVMDEIARKNDTNPERIAKFVHEMVTGADPMKVERSTGRVVYGGEKFYVNRDALERIAKLRAQNSVREQDAANKDKETEGALGTVKRAVTEWPNVNVQNPAPDPVETDELAQVRADIDRTNQELARVTAGFNPDRKREKELRQQYDELRAKLKALRKANTPAVE